MEHAIHRIFLTMFPTYLSQIFPFAGFQILYNFLKMYEETFDKTEFRYFPLLSSQELYVHFQPILLN